VLKPRNDNIMTLTQGSVLNNTIFHAPTILVIIYKFCGLQSGVSKDSVLLRYNNVASYPIKIPVLNISTLMEFRQETES
jgi:hypothetical protein